MSDAQNWAEALNISPEKLNEWSSSEHDGRPLLVWCLQHGHVSWTEYTEWASNNYGIPILSPDFFKTDFDLQKMTEIRKQSEWSPWYFPVSRWEDVTIVACVEPPTEAPPGQFSFVLADPRILQDIWGEEEVPTSEPPPVTAPPAIEAPVGIDLKVTKVFQLNLGEMDTNSTHEPSKPTVSQPAPELKVSASLPDPQNEDTVPPQVPQHTSVTRVISNSHKPTNEEDEFNGAFERLRLNYQSSIILRRIVNGVEAYKWDSALELTKTKKTFSLNEPSFLRIVAKTLQPYHGYVVDSPLHREFFNSLNLKTAPACVTALPLKTENNMWGILVAFGNENAQSGDALQTAQLVADKITSSLATQWSKSA